MMTPTITSASPASPATPVLSHWRRIPGPPRDPLKARLLRLHRTLREQFGSPGSRPGRTPFAIAVGAMLARPTGETNVEHVLTSLRRARLRSPRALARIEEARLATVI